MIVTGNRAFIQVSPTTDNTPPTTFNIYTFTLGDTTAVPVSPAYTINGYWDPSFIDGALFTTGSWAAGSGHITRMNQDGTVTPEFWYTGSQIYSVGRVQ
jgi:hypothetical protein